METVKILVNDTFKFEGEERFLDLPAYEGAVETALKAAVAAARVAGATGAVVLEGERRIGCGTEFSFRIDDAGSYTLKNETTLFERVWVASNLPGCSGHRTVRVIGAIL